MLKCVFPVFDPEAYNRLGDTPSLSPFCEPSHPTPSKGRPFPHTDRVCPRHQHCNVNMEAWLTLRQDM